MNYAKTPPAEREARAKRMAGLARQAMLDALKMKLRESTFVFFTERTPHAYLVGVFLLGTGNVSQVFEGERLMGRLVVK
ncbi:MAG TPA: hypothetical protein VFY28_00380, partial [Candidatus Paceibacterota bacterium]|nr:hypothetical protein [Candidatus Paceibacterota bacterium]